MRIEKQTPMGTSQLMSAVKGGATVGTGQLLSSRWAASSRATLAFAWMSLACATPLSVISRISAGTSIFGISYFGRPNESVISFAMLVLVAPNSATFSPAKGTKMKPIILLNVGETPAQCRRDDQTYGDHTEISELLSSRRICRISVTIPEFALKFASA
jgi:hypothetical protein